MNGTGWPFALTAEGFCTREKKTLYGAFGHAAISTRAISFACGSFAVARPGTWRSVLPPCTARITSPRVWRKSRFANAPRRAGVGSSELPPASDGLK